MRLVWEKHPEPVMIILGNLNLETKGVGGRDELSDGCVNRESKETDWRYLCSSAYKIAILSQFTSWRTKISERTSFD